MPRTMIEPNVRIATTQGANPSLCEAAVSASVVTTWTFLRCALGYWTAAVPRTDRTIDRPRSPVGRRRAYGSQSAGSGVFLGDPLPTGRTGRGPDRSGPGRPAR